MKRKISIKLLFSFLLGVVVSSLNKEALNLNAALLYDEDKILTPIWEGNEIYNESVLVIKEKDGTIAPIKLLYDIDEIISVKSATLKNEFKLNEDYKVVEKKLVIIPSGNIPSISYDTFHPQNGNDGFEDRNGGYIFFNEGAYFHNLQIVITYTHSDKYSLYIPEGKGKLLPKTLDKLNNMPKDKEFNILVYGDSISTGANSSGHPMINASPNMPIYPRQVVLGLKQKYRLDNVCLYNASVGGTDSTWGLANIRTNIFNKYDVDFDLIIVAFGMNDIKNDAKTVGNNIKRIATSLLNKYKNSEVLMIGTMLPNPNAINFVGEQEKFYDELVQYEKEGLVAVNITRVHKDLLKVKRYSDLTGNNVNHANDFLARIYAQTILQTLKVSDYGDKEEPINPDISSSNSEDNSSSFTSENSSTNNTTNDSSSTITKKGCNGYVSLKYSIIIISFILLLLKIKRKESNL